MKTDRQIYLLNPKELSPETIAVTFAKTSRSPESFREIAADLSDESSAQFNEKWVVGYGHSSVAEHAVLHIAIENVSRLAVETIESNRLASYTEKSTRYQKWNSEAFYTPKEICLIGLEATYQSVCRNLFSTYMESLDCVREVVLRESPRPETENMAAWERKNRTQYIDVCRYLLPACSLANVGMTANARVLEHCIQKMLSSSLSEVRAIGSEIKEVSQSEIPSLVRYAEKLPYLEESKKALAILAGDLPNKSDQTSWCQLVNYDPQGEERILAAALYRFGEVDYTTAFAYVQNLDYPGRLKIANSLFKDFGGHDIPLRELEHTFYTFDIVLDQGAYFEVKRHRMMTQTTQNLTASLGYAIPKKMITSGFEEKYRKAMDQAEKLYTQIKEIDPDLAGYVLPNGFNRRVLLTMNLREAFHFCSLRSAANAHFSVRRGARKITEQIRTVHPILASFLQIPEGETWENLTEDYFHLD